MLVLVTVWLLISTQGGSCATFNINDAADLQQLVLNCTNSAAMSTTSSNSSCDSLTLHLTSDLQLDSPVIFTLYSISIQGEGGIRTISCTASNSGLVFHGTSHVEMRAVTLIGCATVRSYPYSDTNQTYVITSALHIVLTRYVSLSNVTVTRSPGMGLLLAYNNIMTNITDCNFIGNRLPNSAESAVGNALGGGGVYLYIQDSVPHSQFLFDHCVFSDNTADNTQNYSYLFVNESGNPIEGRGRGGGILINTRSNVFNNTIMLTRCQVENNSAFLGSGVSVEIEQENSSNNHVLVVESQIVQNGCQRTASVGMGSGGGAILAFRHGNSSTNNNNIITFQEVNFADNCALVGGGAYFFSSRESEPDINNQLVFHNCTWTGNTARIGSAVNIAPDIFERRERGYSTVPVFRSCVFANNSVSNSSPGPQQYDNTGTVYTSLYNLKFESTAEFSNNAGTALYAVNAAVDFTECSATFESNRGIQGGGVALIGTSSMLIGPHNYTFRDNVAADKGGGIYSYLVDSHDFVVSRSCFLQYRESTSRNIPSTRWKGRVYFQGNYARSNHGHDIFASSLHPCQIVNDGQGNEFEVLDIVDIFQPPGVNFMEGAGNRRLSTNGAGFTDNTGQLQIIPGEQFHLGLHVVDDLDQVITGMLAASFSEQRIKLDSSSTCLTNQIIQLKGTPLQEDILMLQELSARGVSLSVGVQLLECPAGYKLSAEQQCVCDALSYSGLVRCDDEKLQAFLRTGYWAGLVNTSEGRTVLASTICPYGFCSYNTNNRSKLEIALPRSRSVEELETAICGEERSGILCGKCNPGYVVHFHSPTLHCEAKGSYSCNRLGWLFYILSEIIPATILFVVVLVFNISFTSGALNGFILFSQVLDTLLVDASGVIIFSDDVKRSIDTIRMIYGFFNLDFFYIKSLSFCVWESASVLDILAFKYLTVVYSVFLIAGVIIFMKHCGARCFHKYHHINVARYSVIHGLSTFLVICYAQCIKVSFTLLYYGNLNVSPTETTKLHRTVWFSGELKFFSAGHLPYALPALAVLLVVGVIPPVILLTYPAIFRILTCLKVPDSCIDRLLPTYNTFKPFLDAFQGSFKDNFRFFAGLYFLYRWVGVLIIAGTTSYTLFYATVELLLLLMLMVHALCQPYRSRWHNILDTIILADLGLINMLTAVHYYASRVDSGQLYQRNIEKSGSLQVVLMYLPFTYFISYVLIQVAKKLIPYKKCELTRGGKSDTLIELSQLRKQSN